MEFSGKLLKRGFWLYIWDIREDRQRHLYVGRTGDSSSPNASSPFRRIGQHLDLSINAKGNALLRQLKKAGVDAETCTFEMTAIGPIFEEQETMDEHKPLRDKTAALETALAEELKRRGYKVLGNHLRASDPDRKLLEHVISQLQPAFPDKQVAPSKPRFEPIRPDGSDPSASEIVIADRKGVSLGLDSWDTSDWTVKDDRTVSRFNPVPIRGEPLSATILRDRVER